MCQFHKMVKYTQIFRQQIANELFECVWPFYGIGTLRVNLENVEKKRKIQKTKYLKNEKSFLDEIKGFFIVFEGLSFGERNRKYKHKL